MSFSYVSTEKTCQGFGIALNLTSHLFLVSFDVFVLFVTFYVANKDKIVYRLSCLVLLNRLVWAVADIILSSASWDSEAFSCNYNQYEITGLGYNCSDLICDFYATATVLWITSKRFSSSSQLVRSILEKNVSRSIVIIAQASFLMYASVAWTDQYALAMAWNMQTYILARCVNYDLLFTVDPDKWQTVGTVAKKLTQSLKRSMSQSRVPQNIIDDEVKQAWTEIASRKNSFDPSSRLISQDTPDLFLSNDRIGRLDKSTNQSQYSIASHCNHHSMPRTLGITDNRSTGGKSLSIDLDPAAEHIRRSSPNPTLRRPSALSVKLPSEGQKTSFKNNDNSSILISSESVNLVTAIQPRRSKPKDRRASFQITSVSVEHSATTHNNSLTPMWSNE
ncbi:hypothetical protein BCR33DRAFT_766670 [Rhizoclosmatium globosum]|uniref:Uncharacterized protein n=1 Tax=Rhizoclosmatium globosum TaxID=329046 RepID=A0A1Y2C8Z5_9FUNG|nr:hypothetical protein BCR33DRAFT_766670 [Rhizoclosmatium globosum]|eukprot:ORY43499.1 hypothetical protein BCR33DRAFT_766670 [Rhizoclosmatium globosum]